MNNRNRTFVIKHSKICFFCRRWGGGRKLIKLANLVYPKYDFGLWRTIPAIYRQNIRYCTRKSANKYDILKNIFLDNIS